MYRCGELRPSRRGEAVGNSYGAVMAVPRREYTVLVCHWGDQWDVFVLDPVEGLVGSTTASTYAEVEHVARALVGEHLQRPGPAHDVRVNVVRR